MIENQTILIMRVPGQLDGTSSIVSFRRVLTRFERFVETDKGMNERLHEEIMSEREGERSLESSEQYAIPRRREIGTISIILFLIILSR
jgi:hypothetical protein